MTALYGSHFYFVDYKLNKKWKHDLHDHNNRQTDHKSFVLGFVANGPHCYIHKKRPAE